MPCQTTTALTVDTHGWEVVSKSVESFLRGSHVVQYAPFFV